jgi:ADP-heptose:LPS heptosyltransferase
MKILIIRFSSIGDIVLTTPVVRNLKEQLPDAELHYLTKESFKTILESNPYIDKLHYLGDRWDIMISELKSECFDLVIDLHHNLRTAGIKRALKVKSHSFPKLNIEKWLLTNFKINRMPDLHIVDRYMQTVSTLGIVNDGKGLDYFIPEHEQIKLEDLPHAHFAGYIAVVIGAAHATKRMPVDLLQDLCQSIHHPIILLGGPEDQANGHLIASVDPVKIYNACGKFSLNESADILRKSKLVISHDTGLMHIAAALRKQIICIWGNTVPAFGMYPYYGHQPVVSVNMQVKNLSCRPCSKIGSEKCPKKHFKCMRNQDIAAIASMATTWAREWRPV